MLALLLALALIAPRVGHAADVTEPATWRPVENVDGIRVWAADPPGEFWGLARGSVAASADAIFRRLSDFESLPDMYPWLDSVRVLERAEASSLVYFHYDLPWPLSDREFTAAHRWRTEPSGAISFTAEHVPGIPPRDPTAVQVEDLLIRMTFTPSTVGGVTDVEYLIRTDMGGMLPRVVRAETAWKIPMNVILSMRRTLEPHGPRTR